VGGYVINMAAIRRSTRGALFVALVGSALLIGLGTAAAQIVGAVHIRPHRSERTPNLRHRRGWRRRACRRDGSNWASADQASDPATPFRTPACAHHPHRRRRWVGSSDASRYSVPPPVRRGVSVGGSRATVCGRVCRAETSRCRPYARWSGSPLQ
jgi:hypothetical protein